MKKIRIGLIGCGRFGKCHAEVLTRSSYAKLVAIAVRSETTRRKIQEQFNVPVSTDYRRLLEREDIEAVDIVLPSDLHERVSIDALQSGRHVFVEKPMAITTKQCDSMLAEAEKQKRSLCVNFELRMSPLWGRVKEDILRGTIGEPRCGLFDLWRFPFRPGSDRWRFTERRVGSWLHEEPIHFFDLAAWFFEDAGTPVQITCNTAGGSCAPPALSDNITCILRWAGGQFFQVGQSNSFFGYHQMLRVVGTHGSIVTTWDGNIESDETAKFNYFVVQGGKHRRTQISEKSSEFLDLNRNIEAFCQHLLGKNTDVAKGEDGRQSVAIVEAGLRSARSGRPIKIHL